MFSKKFDHYSVFTTDVIGSLWQEVKDICGFTGINYFRSYSSGEVVLSHYHNDECDTLESLQEECLSHDVMINMPMISTNDLFKSGMNHLALSNHTLFYSRMNADLSVSQLKLDFPDEILMSRSMQNFSFFERLIRTINEVVEHAFKVNENVRPVVSSRKYLCYS